MEQISGGRLGALRCMEASIAVLDKLSYCAGSHFGAVIEDVKQAPYQAGETVEVKFQSACPRNNLRTEGTFLSVQRYDVSSGQWHEVRISSRATTQVARCISTEASTKTPTVGQA